MTADPLPGSSGRSADDGGAGAAGPLERLRIEVVYAQPERAWRVQLLLPAGATARQAFEASGLRSRIADLQLGDPDLGVFASPVGADHRLRDGDRVEIYRPLLIDPKDARRRRAAQS